MNLVTARQFLQKLRDDPNWSKTQKGCFELFARREILLQGSSAEPVQGYKLDRVDTGCGFHGMPEAWFKELTKQAGSISQRWQKSGSAAFHASRPIVPVLFWDDRFELPIEEFSVSVVSAKRKRLGEMSPQVAILLDDHGQKTQDGFVIFVPMPLRQYWGGLRLEYLKGALCHEMAHVWTSWSCPNLQMALFWGVIDEMTAVWAENSWVGCRSALDYAAIWANQDCVSLYGVTVEDGQPNTMYGYSQFPFFSWLTSAIGTKGPAKRKSDMVSAFWETCSSTHNFDPWQHLDQYCGDALTCAFRKKHLAAGADAGWYLKCVQEVHQLRDEPLELKGQKLQPLSKRAYLFVMNGDCDYEVVLESSSKDFVLHVLEDDGNGQRHPCKIVDSDDTSPFAVRVPKAKYAVLVVGCTALASQRDINSFQIKPHQYRLLIRPVTVT
jgi:hypothetical protein